MQSVIAKLEHARMLAGGVSKLAEKVGVDVYLLDEMLHGIRQTPPWVLERVSAFIRAHEPTGADPEQ